MSSSVKGAPYCSLILKLYAIQSRRSFKSFNSKRDDDIVAISLKTVVTSVAIVIFYKHSSKLTKSFGNVATFITLKRRETVPDHSAKALLNVNSKGSRGAPRVGPAGATGHRARLKYFLALIFVGGCFRRGGHWHANQPSL